MMFRELDFRQSLYQQVYDKIRERIISGAWKPGSLVPGDVQLSQSFGVSVGTVRKALDQLAREHFVVRERGRGTFVKLAENWNRAGSPRLLDGNAAAVEISMDVLSNEIVASTDRTAAKLAGGTRWHRLVRRWTSGRQLVCMELLMVDGNQITTLSDESLTLEFPADAYVRQFRAPIEMADLVIFRPAQGGDSWYAPWMGDESRPELIGCTIKRTVGGIPVEQSERLYDLSGDLRLTNMPTLLLFRPAASEQSQPLRKLDQSKKRSA